MQKKFTAFNSQSSIEIDIGTWYSNGKPNGLNILAISTSGRADVANVYGQKFTEIITALLSGEAIGSQVMSGDDLMGGSLVISLAGKAINIRIVKDHSRYAVDALVSDTQGLVNYLLQFFISSQAVKFEVSRCNFPKCQNSFSDDPDANVIVVKNGQENKFCEGCAERLVANGVELKSRNQILRLAKALADKDIFVKEDNEEINFINSLKD